MPEKRFNLLTLQEAMDLLGVSRATIDRWRKHKGLPYIKIGKEVMIDPDALEQWIRMHNISLEPTMRNTISPTKSKNIVSVTIGYQSGTAHMWTPVLIKELKLLEAELTVIRPNRPVRIEWKDAPNGLELLKGLVGGSIHIASLGDYPIVLGQTLSRILPTFRSVLLAFDGKSSSGLGISVVVPSSLDRYQLEDLYTSSSPIATVPNSSAGFRLYRLSTLLGRRNIQVVHREMHESLSEITENRIGASIMWEPYVSLAKYLETGQVLFDDGLGEEDYLTGVVAEGNWIMENEEIVIAYLKAHLRAHQFIRCEPERAALIVSQSTGFPAAVAYRVLTKVRWDAAIYARDIHTLEHINSLQTHGLLHLPIPDPNNRVETNTDYLRIAAQMLHLPELPVLRLQGEWMDDCLY